ncbi:MAG: hypothetical protein AAGI92_03270 [Pseudomonadota bacterium]
MEDTLKLEVGLHGVFDLKWSDGTKIVLKSAKGRGLLALLLLSTSHTIAKSTAQNTLWQYSTLTRQQSSLRRCICEVRDALAPHFDDVITQDSFHIKMNADRISVVTSASDGELLEDLKVPTEAFEAWVETERLKRSRDEASVDYRSLKFHKPVIAILPFMTTIADQKEKSSDFSVQFMQLLARLISRWTEIEVLNPLSVQRFKPGQFDLVYLRRFHGVTHVVHGALTLSDAKRFDLQLDLTDSQTGQVTDCTSVSGRRDTALSGQSSIVSEIAAKVNFQLADIFSRSSRDDQDQRLEHSKKFAAAVVNTLRGDEGVFQAGADTVSETLEENEFPSDFEIAFAKQRWRSVLQGWNTQLADFCLAEARSRVADVLSREPLKPEALAMHGFLELHGGGDVDHIAETAHKAKFVRPHCPWSLSISGFACALQGDFNRALQNATAAKTNASVLPYNSLFVTMNAWVAFLCGEHALCANLTANALRVERFDRQALILRIVALINLRRFEEARRATQMLLDRHAGTTIVSILTSVPISHDVAERMLGSALREAELPKGNPLPITDYAVGFAEKDPIDTYEPVEE